MRSLENGFQNEQGVGVILDSSVYFRLNSIAGRMLRRERRYQDWEPADLVHEAFLRIACGRIAVQFQNPNHVIAFMRTVMGHILTDRARGSTIFDRSQRVLLDPELTARYVPAIDGIVLRDLIERLRRKHDRASQVVELLTFGGMTIDEVASRLSVCSRTVKRDWNTAQKWFGHRLGKPATHDSKPHLVVRRPKVVPPSAPAPMSDRAAAAGGLMEVA